MRQRSNQIGSHRRAVEGCILTLREQETGRTLVWHISNVPRDTRRDSGVIRTGYFSDTLREAIDAIRAMEGDWCIVTVSTPQTILRDLRNDGRHIAEGLTGRGSRGHEGNSVGKLTPEEELLGPLDALDLIERLPIYRMPARHKLNHYRPEAIS